KAKIGIRLTPIFVFYPIILSFFSLSILIIPNFSNIVHYYYLFFSLFYYSFHFLCKLTSRNHYPMIAAYTFDSNVHPHTPTFPAVFSTWMGLLHFNYVV